MGDELVFQLADGADCWMGPYRGAGAHGGLDVNHPAGTSLWAPMAIDDHAFYNHWTGATTTTAGRASTTGRTAAETGAGTRLPLVCVSVFVNARFSVIRPGEE